MGWKGDRTSPNFVYKTSDESLAASTTLQTDDHLFLDIEQPGSYVVDIYLYASSSVNNAGDLTVALAFPTGAGFMGVHAQDVGLASGVAGSLTSPGGPITSGVAAFNVGLSTSNNFIWLHGLINATGTGPIQLRWAQFTATGTTTLRSGSHMTVDQRA